MSVAAMTWAFAQDIKSKSAKLTLLALADRVNKDSDFSCFPSLATLCKDTGLSRRCVIYALNWLIAEGLVSRTRQYRPDGFQRSNAYRLHVVSGVQNLHPSQGCKPCTPGVQTLHPNNEPEKNLKRLGILKSKKAPPIASPAMVEISQDDRRVPGLRRERVKLIPTKRFTFMVEAKALTDHAA